MSAEFIRAQARRANRKLIIVNLLLAGAAAGIFSVFQKELLGVATGVQPLDTKALFAAKGPDDLSQYYVTFKPEQLIRANFDKVITSKGSKSVKKYLLAKIGDRVLTIEAWEDRDEKEISGYLVALPSEVDSRVHQMFRSAGVATGVFPVMVDAATPTFGYWIGITALALPFLLGVWNLFNALNRLMSIDRHPSVARLRRYGELDAVIAGIDGEAGAPAGVTVLGPVTVTPNWLVRRTAFGLDVIRLEDLAWIYEKVTQHSTNGVPTGKTFAAMLWDRDGRSIEIGGKEPVVVQTLREIAVRVPWVLVGFSAELDKDWKNNRKVVMTVLDDRRSQIEAARSGEPPAKTI